MLIVVTVPILISMFVVLGAMGMFGVHFNLESIVIFSLTFAIAANNIFYFLTKLNGELIKGRSYIVVLESTYISTGKTIVLSTLVLLTGFSSLLFLNIGGVFNIWLLTFIGFICSLILSLTVLPILLFLFNQKSAITDNQKHN